MKGAVAKPPKVDGEKVGFFRFRPLGGRMLLTNDIGEHMVLTRKEFARFTEGRLGARTALHRELRAKGFVRDYLPFDRMVERWRRRHQYLWQGPTLHIVVATLRCDHRCAYCQTSSVGMDEKGYDMTEATARKVVDTIFQSPNPALTIEFQGGEPLANWPVVRFIVEYALEKNKEAQKTLWLNLVTNLSLMDEEKLDFLLERGVNFCTSIDGPAELHDANRTHRGGGSYEQAARWWKRIVRRTRGRAFRIDGLVTTTRLSLKQPRKIVDTYVGLGARGVYLRPLSPFGLAKRTWETIGYTPEEFLAFYRKALDYILELNLGGKRFFEQTARIFAAKIFKEEDPNFLDLRSPCGAGTGQVAYGPDGRVYTCDEGRMLSRMSEEGFCLGDVSKSGYGELINHPVVSALATASLLENQPECSRCAYLPYCGTCPVQNYVEHGDLFPRTPLSTRCRVNKGILDHLFRRMEDEKVRKVLQGWTRHRQVPSLYQRN
jgi:His-Xaa-Ser system radical SAM maturase HxsB